MQFVDSRETHCQGYVLLMIWVRVFRELQLENVCVSFWSFLKVSKMWEKIVAARDSWLFFIRRKVRFKVLWAFYFTWPEFKMSSDTCSMAWRKKDFCYTILSSWTYGFEMTFEFFVQKDWAATAPFSLRNACVYLNSKLLVQQWISIYHYLMSTSVDGYTFVFSEMVLFA